MNDPHGVLGVSKTATQDEIKRAYRKLAQKHHPDRGGNEDRFKQINEAYEILSDPAKKQQWQRSQFYGEPDFATSGFGFDDVFSDIFGRRGRPRQPTSTKISLWVHLKDITQPTKKIISVDTAKGVVPVELEIPPGVLDGENIKYPGLAPGGLDLVVNFRIHGDPVWQRDGLDLLCEKTVSVWNLILGATVRIEDITGTEYNLKIPSMCKPDSVLKLKGKGLQRLGHAPGDMLVKVKAALPATVSDELKQAIKTEIDY
mgnify:CR=1 FL=1